MPSARVCLFDTLRGFTLLSMVCFHACYDASYLFGIELPWFTEGFLQDAWRASISWTFLFIAGWMTSFSRDNRRRALRYAASALVVFVVTSLVAVDAAVNFGILFCMAASTFLFTLLERPMHGLDPRLLALVALACFLSTFGVPRASYPLPGFAWLGFPSSGFSSGDYYPLIPYCFLYLASAALARAKHEQSDMAYPSWAMRNPLPWLSAIGRHSLAVYLLHQPVLLGLLTLMYT